jgi:hypothetical protein
VTAATIGMPSVRRRPAGLQGPAERSSSSRSGNSSVRRRPPGRPGHRGGRGRAQQQQQVWQSVCPSHPGRAAGAGRAQQQQQVWYFFRPSPSGRAKSFTMREGPTEGDRGFNLCSRELEDLAREIMQDPIKGSQFKFEMDLVELGKRLFGGEAKAGVSFQIEQLRRGTP